MHLYSFIYTHIMGYRWGELDLTGKNTGILSGKVT